MTYPYKLDPCPFCGGSAEIYEPWPNANVKEFYVVHEADEYSDCPAITDRLTYRLRHRTARSAANSWNIRLGVK